MARSPAALFGGPCNGKTVIISYTGYPPISYTCQGTTYHRYPTGNSGLMYVTADWTGQQAHAEAVAGQRDVFKAWHRVMRALHRTSPGERRRIVGARHRIRRAVK